MPDVRVDTAEGRSVGPEDLEEVVLRAPQDVVRLLTLYGNLDVPKDPGDLFLFHLSQARNTWFVEVGDIGLVYLTDIVPDISGNLRVMFWDRLLRKERGPAVKYFLWRAATLFNLQRISLFTIPDQQRLAIFCQKHLGFKYEGTLRKGHLTGDGLVDLSVWSIIREEIDAWQLQTISSARI